MANDGNPSITVSTILERRSQSWLSVFKIVLTKKSCQFINNYDRNAITGSTIDLIVMYNLISRSVGQADVIPEH